MRKYQFWVSKNPGVYQNSSKDICRPPTWEELHLGSWVSVVMKTDNPYKFRRKLINDEGYSSVLFHEVKTPWLKVVLAVSLPVAFAGLLLLLKFYLER